MLRNKSIYHRDNLCYTGYILCFVILSIVSSITPFDLGRILNIMFPLTNFSISDIISTKVNFQFIKCSCICKMFIKIPFTLFKVYGLFNSWSSNRNNTKFSMYKIIFYSLIFFCKNYCPLGAPWQAKIQPLKHLLPFGSSMKSF